MSPVELRITLFGKPAWEIENFENKELDIKFAEELKKLGDKLREHLHEIAKLHETLIKNGWVATGGLYDIIYWKDINPKEAQEELKKLGLEKYTEYLEEIPEEKE